MCISGFHDPTPLSTNCPTPEEVLRSILSRRLGSATNDPLVAWTVHDTVRARLNMFVIELAQSCARSGELILLVKLVKLSPLLALATNAFAH